MKPIPFTEEHSKQLRQMLTRCFPHATILGSTVFIKDQEYHWFEFVMIHLTDCAYGLFYMEMERTGRPKNVFERDIFFSQVLSLGSIHPIEYLHETFKLFKLC